MTQAPPKATKPVAPGKPGASATGQAAYVVEPRDDGDTGGRAAGQAPAGDAPVRSAGSDAAAAGASAITPEQALANTRELLEAKQAQARAPQPWQALDGSQPDAPKPGYQSDAAAAKAQGLHEAESRLPSIQGSSSTRDRIGQGKRDARRGQE